MTRSLAARTCGRGARGARLVLGLSVLVGSVLLFVGGPGPLAPRSAARLWDVGHVALFFAGVVTVLEVNRWGRAPLAGRLWGAVLVGALALGAGTEALQPWFGRDASWGDLARDLLGAGAGLVAAAPLPSSARWRATLRAGMAALLVAACLPAGAALWDEAAARREFPVLADFEGRWELERWGGSAGLSLDRTRSRSGRRSLRVELGTEEYSGVFLRYFPGDWRGYRVLRFSVCNAEQTALGLTCRIHDREHLRGGQTPSDRFRWRFTAGPGWTDVEIPLSAAAAAPRGRAMDLGRVAGFGLFATRLPTPRTIYLDALRLER